MAGCMQYFNGYIAYAELFAIFCYMHRKFCYGTRAIHNGCTRGSSKVQVAAHKIGMKMRFENVFYFGVALLGHL